MKNYYVNNTAQSSGDHEVHTDECQYFQSIISKKFLGSFASCKPAVEEAKKTYAKLVAMNAIQPNNHGLSISKKDKTWRRTWIQH